LINAPIVEGMLPVRLLESNDRLVKLDKLEIVIGIVPVKPLEVKEMLK
jgi:hypothetical protein